MFSLKNRFVYAIVCYFLAVLIAFVGIPIVLSKTYSKTEAVRVINPVAKGEQLKKDNLKVVEIARLHLPEGMILSIEDAVGRYATIDMVADDYIMAAKISQLPFDGNSLPEELPEGAAAVSISVKMLEGSIDKEFRSGDVIQLYHFKERLMEVPELQFVRVLSVVTEEKDGSTLTVLAMTKQADKLNQMKKEGAIYGVLISRDNDTLAEALLKQQTLFLNPN